MLGACNSDSDATLAEPSEARRATVATESRPDIGRTLGQEIVRKGAGGSTADRLAFAQAANGDSSYLKTLTSIRALHARSLDSAITDMSPERLVLASPEAVGHANYQVESGGIELSSAGTGLPTIVAVNTTGTFTSNGATSNLTGHVSFRGSSVNARVEWQSANFEGSLPSVQGSFNGYDLEPNLVAYGQCVRDNPTNYGTACAGLESYYTTITPPSIELGQPCGTRVHAYTEATAKWDLWVLGAVLDMLGPIPWSLMGSPIFYSNQFVEGTRIIGPNNQCVRPIVSAAFGGSATGSGGEYSATIPSGATTVEVSIYGWVTNAPLPAAEEYLLAGY